MAQDYTQVDIKIKSESDGIKSMTKIEGQDTGYIRSTIPTLIELLHGLGYTHVSDVHVIMGEIDGEHCVYGRHGRISATPTGDNL